MNHRSTTPVVDAPGVEIHGYDFGMSGSAHSPISLEELHQIEQSAGWTNEDAQVLQRHSSIFLNHAEEMVDAWRSVIASQPHLSPGFRRTGSQA